MEVESHEFSERPFNSKLCNECDLHKGHPVHGIHQVLGIRKPVLVDTGLGRMGVICNHESWTCSGSSPWVKHSCNDCDWCWTNTNNPGFKYCELCKVKPNPESEAVWVTKDSGQRESYDSGMVRDTQDDKPRFDLLFPVGVPYPDQFLTRVAGLLARGAEKYTERNWEKAEGEAELNRFRASALRHLTQWLCDETDEDHMAAVVFNLMGAHLVEWKMAHKDGSDD